MNDTSIAKYLPLTSDIRQDAEKMINGIIEIGERVDKDGVIHSVAELILLQDLAEFSPDLVQRYDK